MPAGGQASIFAAIAFAGRTVTLADVFSDVSEPPWFPWLAERPYKITIGVITTQRILYWLAAMVVLLVVGTTIGLIWPDSSDVAGVFAGVTNIVSVVGIVLLLIALAVKRRRRPS